MRRRTCNGKEKTDKEKQQMKSRELEPQGGE